MDIKFFIAVLVVIVSFASCEKSVVSENGPAGTEMIHPVKLKLVAMDSVSALLEWRFEGTMNDPSFPDLIVDIEQSSDGINFSVVKSIFPATLWALLTSSYTSNGTYHFRLRLRSGEQFSAYSNIERHNINEEKSLLSVGGEQVLVSGGSFIMGSPAGEGESNERPQHTVTVMSFRIGRTEVTRRMWREVVEWKQGSATSPLSPDPSLFKTDENAPVEKVSWEEAQTWLGYLNEKAGITDPTEQYRLPTEAEWEYAARGGATLGERYEYSGSDTVETVAWYELNSGKRTHNVGTRRANQLGLFDMSGNVWEWVQDRYGAYQSNAQHDPVGSDVGDYRIVRGGSWLLSHGSSRVANRSLNPPAWRGSCTGFRIVRGL